MNSFVFSYNLDFIYTVCVVLIKDTPVDSSTCSLQNLCPLRHTPCEGLPVQG